MDRDRAAEPAFEPLLRGARLAAVIVVLASLVAVALATFAPDKYALLWQQRFALSFTGRFNLDLTLRHWVNDGLMAFVLLAATLALRDGRDAALALAAATGGLVVPALLYIAIAGAPAGGWGIPAASDLILAVGVMAWVRPTIPAALFRFVIAVAILDDLAAVVATAVLDGTYLDGRALYASAALFVLLVVFNRAGMRHRLPYALVGLALWYMLLLSGIQAAIAGILVGLTLPREGSLRAITPWVAFGVVPLVVLANAGIDLHEWRAVNTLPLALVAAIAAGLVVGKFAGVTLGAWMAVRVGIARLPEGVAWGRLLGAAWLTGIGFTMSLFMAAGAFEGTLLLAAKIGIFAGSAASAAIGLAWLSGASGRNSHSV